MIDDPNIEHEDKPEYDEDGNQIWYMPVLPDMDEFTPYNFNNAPENIPDGYYESVWSNGTASTYTKARTTEEKLTDPVDVIIENTNTNYKDEQGQLNALETKYNEAANKIVTILTNVLAKGKITGEDNAEFLAAQHELTMYSGKIKDLCDIQTKDKEIKSANEIKSKFQNATADEILDLLTDGGTKPWLYKDDNNNVLVDGQSIPEVTMLVNKLNLIATDGEDESQLQLTPEFINLISTGDITFTAEHINLNGYINEGGNWSVDNEGNMRAENLKIEGNVASDTLSVNYIDNPCYPATLPGSVHLYVNANTGNDDYTIDDILQSYDEAEEKSDDTLRRKFKTLQGALDASPAFLNNKNLRITLETDTTEDVYVRGFSSGAVRIYLNGHTIYGYVKGYVNSAVYLYGGTVDDTTATQGVIHPNMGYNLASRCVSTGFEACQYVALYKVKVFGADNNPSNVSSNYKVAVASSSGTGNIYCSDVQITNCAIGFRANNMGCIHVAKSSGKASRYGFESITGGQISLTDADQAGGLTENTHKSSGGQIWYESPTFDGNSESKEDSPAPSTSTTKTMTIKSTYGDTYRSSVYNNWKKDGTARQGDYGYGDCTGCWFFGTAFTELKGKTITKVQITITRQTGGSSVPVEHKLWMHRYTSRPSGAPTLTSGWSQTFRLATGNSTTVAITNSAVLNAISAGTCKGFALRNTYDSVHYSVCSGNVTVKITYTE